MAMNNNNGINWDQLIANMPSSSPKSAYLSSGRCVDIAEVTGSTPVPPTTFTRPSSGDILPLINMLEAFLGPKDAGD